MLEVFAIACLIYASLDRQKRLSKLISFIGLGIAIYTLRTLPEGAVALIYATATVFLFWIAQSIRFSLSNVRTLVLMILGLALALFIFRDFLPSDSKKMTGTSLAFELNPALIESLQTSHEKAFEVFLRHSPTADDRYFRMSSLSETINGLDYHVGARSPLHPENFPLTVNWVKQNLKPNELAPNLAVIKKWWADNFIYSLTPGRMKSKAPLDEFLFTRRKGFCEHYAAALTTLLKLAGFDSRVAVGFSGGSWNQITRTLSFELADAHAWTEVYDPNLRQWKRVDPTEWVFAEKSMDDETWSRPVVISLGVGLFVVLAWVLRRKRSLPESLLAAVVKIEKKKSLEGQGLTIRERLHQIEVLDPKGRDLYKKVTKLYEDFLFSELPGDDVAQKLKAAIFKLSLKRYFS